MMMMKLDVFKFFKVFLATFPFLVASKLVETLDGDFVEDSDNLGIIFDEPEYSSDNPETKEFQGSNDMAKTPTTRNHKSTDDYTPDVIVEDEQPIADESDSTPTIGSPTNQWSPHEHKDLSPPVQNDAPENIPGNLPKDALEDIPGESSEGVSEVITEDLPGSPSGGVLDDLPGGSPEDVLEDLSGEPSEDIPEDVLEDIPGEPSEDVAENPSDGVLEDLPGGLSEGIPEIITEDTPEDISEDTPEDISEDTPEDISEDIPEDISEDIPEDISEDIPDPSPSTFQMEYSQNDQGYPNDIPTGSFIYDDVTHRTTISPKPLPPTVNSNNIAIDLSQKSALPQPPPPTTRLPSSIANLNLRNNIIYLKPHSSIFAGDESTQSIPSIIPQNEEVPSHVESFNDWAGPNTFKFP